MEIKQEVQCKKTPTKRIANTHQRNRFVVEGDHQKYTHSHADIAISEVGTQLWAVAVHQWIWLGIWLGIWIWGMALSLQGGDLFDVRDVLHPQVLQHEVRVVRPDPQVIPQTTFAENDGKKASFTWWCPHYIAIWFLLLFKAWGLGGVLAQNISGGQMVHVPSTA